MLTHYLLGFLSCDGSLDKNGSTISLQIQKRDAPVLDLLEDALAKEGVETTRDSRTINSRHYERTRCHAREVFDELIDLFGGRLKVDRKWPSWATTDFLRGVWDADGHFSARRNSIEGEISHPSVLWLEALGQFVSESSSIAVRNIENRNGYSRLGISPNHCRWFRDHVYSTGPFLQRKLDPLLTFHEPGPGRHWNALELDYLRAHFEPGSESWKEIAKHLGRSPKSVSKKIWELGLANG